MKNNIDFQARIWLYNGTIDNLEVWVYEFKPIKSDEDSEIEFIEDVIGKYDMYNELHLDPQKNYQVLIKGCLKTTWVCENYVNEIEIKEKQIMELPIIG
jgi:hypothetical protein